MGNGRALIYCRRARKAYKNEMGKWPLQSIGHNQIDTTVRKSAARHLESTASSSGEQGLRELVCLINPSFTLTRSEHCLIPSTLDSTRL